MDGQGRRSGLLIRGAYAVCLLAGTSTHLATLSQYGLFWTYGGVNIAIAVFWNSLVFADPLAAALLFLRPRAGLMLTSGIMVPDVLINASFYGSRLLHEPSRIDLWFTAALGLQVAFLIFVAATVRIAWAQTRGPAIPAAAAFR